MEDDLAIKEMVESYLIREGFILETASDGEDVLGMLATFDTQQSQGVLQLLTLRN